MLSPDWFDSLNHEWQAENLPVRLLRLSKQPDAVGDATMFTY